MCPDTRVFQQRAENILHFGIKVAKKSIYGFLKGRIMNYDVLDY
jgi:hypothetical protein